MSSKRIWKYTDELDSEVLSCCVLMASTTHTNPFHTFIGRTAKTQSTLQKLKTRENSKTHALIKSLTKAMPNTPVSYSHLIWIWIIFWVEFPPKNFFGDAIVTPSITLMAMRGHFDENRSCTSYLQIDKNSDRLAYHYIERTHSSLAVLFCCGFRSNMNGTKAIALHNHCDQKGISFCRFDYRGHGESSGDFVNCTLSDWIDDASNVLNNVFTKYDRVVIVGSSMGAWVALHLALRYPAKIHGILGLAAAPDFLHDIYDSSTEDQRKMWESDLTVHLPSEYDDGPYPISYKLMEDALRNWGLLDGNGATKKDQKLPIKCRIRLIHGEKDLDIPWQKSIALMNSLESDDVVLSLIKSGDHRLSEPADLRRMLSTLDELLYL